MLLSLKFFRYRAPKVLIGVFSKLVLSALPSNRTWSAFVPLSRRRFNRDLRRFFREQELILSIFCALLLARRLADKVHLYRDDKVLRAVRLSVQYLKSECRRNFEFTGDTVT